MSYKDVFQLAQGKGYKMFFRSHPYPEQIKNISDETAREFELFEIGRIQKWLRDTHKISVNCAILFESKGEYQCQITKATNGLYKVIGYSVTDYFNSYESALLEGIKAALQLI